MICRRRSQSTCQTSWDSSIPTTLGMVRKCVVCCIIFTHILGTKNVSKEIKKVTQGLVRDRGKVWFPELSDKCKNLLIKLSCTLVRCALIGRSIKIHLYWAMKNCGGSAEKLKEIIMNIPNHCQVSYYCCVFISNTLMFL